MHLRSKLTYLEPFICRVPEKSPKISNADDYKNSLYNTKNNVYFMYEIESNCIKRSRKECHNFQV